MGRSINVASALKLYGYSIQREASEILASELRNIGPSEHDKWYDDLGQGFQNVKESKIRVEVVCRGIHRGDSI